MRKISFRDRFRYAFDNTLSRGPVALVGWLLLATALLVALIAALVVATGIDPERRGFFAMVWVSLTRSLDAGNLSNDSGSVAFLVTMLGAALGGILIVSTLIGILTTNMEQTIERLRKGRSLVVESGHTVILGWSPQVHTIVSELVEANRNRRSSCIAILADRDKIEMQDEIRARVPHSGRTRIVCRTGSPHDLADLEIVNPYAARSIIVLSPEGDNSDAAVIKTVLAITNNPRRRPEPVHIVAAIRDPKNLDAARLVGRDEATLVLAGDLIARIAAQACRQSGLSSAYTELLDFAGDEIYFQEEPQLVGRTFAEALFAYEDSAVIGLRFADGRVQINPPMDTRIAPGDQVIAISRDDDTVCLSGLATPPIETDAIRPPSPRPQVPERTLVLGWNDRAPVIVQELDSYVCAGSTATILVNATMQDGVRSALEPDTAGGAPLRNLAVEVQAGDTADRRTLEGLSVQRYNHVIVLSDPQAPDPQQADARTLVTLLHLRELSDRHGHPFSIVSEMLDVRNQEIAAVTRADDFIVSDRLVSLMLAQLSENRELNPVFEDLFNAEGAELYLKPASDYVQLERPTSYYTIVEAARHRGECAIGYRLAVETQAGANGNGIHLNPSKSELVAYQAADRIVVLATS